MVNSDAPSPGGGLYGHNIYIYGYKLVFKNIMAPSNMISTGVGPLTVIIDLPVKNQWDDYIFVNIMNKILDLSLV